MNDDAPLKYLAENLERQLLPVLGGLIMDRDFAVASRAALVLARAGCLAPAALRRTLHGVCVPSCKRPRARTHAALVGYAFGYVRIACPLAVPFLVG